MKRSLLILLALLALSCTQAQSSYFGLHVGGVADLSDLNSIAPLPGLHLGFPILDSVELRVSILTLLLANFLQVDVLYTQNLSDALRGYGGVGADLGGVAIGDYATIFGVHATAGLEYGVGSGVGLFGEVQPLYVLEAPDYLLSSDPGSALGFFGKLSLGVNIHFELAVTARGLGRQLKPNCQPESTKKLTARRLQLSGRLNEGKDNEKRFTGFGVDCWYVSERLRDYGA